MMLLLICKHRKKIAGILSILFCMDVLLPVIAAAATPAPLYVFTWQKGGHQESNTYRPTDITANKATKHNTTVASARHADVDGPGQPEMKSFQSVNANNLVDMFSGDFSYNIALLDVGGYAVNIHYTSGITMDQEASWVGLGWNINPGSISRTMRGLPDDFDGVSDSIKKTQHIKENKTTGVTIEPSLEIVGAPINVSARLGIFYNTYNGYGMETGVGIGGTGKTSFGSLTGNLSISNNSQQGININPSLSVGLGKQNAENNLQGSLGISTGYSSRGGIASLQINGGVRGNQLTYKTGLLNPGVNYPLATISFATPSYTPSVTMPITNTAYSFTGKVGGEVWGVDAAIAFTGYVNRQEIRQEDATQSIPAVGYLYSANGNNRENVLLDFNRQGDMEFNYKSTPHIAIPQYTYDAFSISGEGVGGSFRPYRGDVGYVFDHAITTRSSSTNGSVDVGLGAVAHGGLEITNITTSNANHRWNQSNGIESKLRFQLPDTTYEPVYFRNPGEKTTNAQSYYRAIGDDSLVRVKLSGSNDNVKAESTLIKYDNEGRKNTELPVSQALVKKQRDKRSQVISYLTAADASVLGLDKTIKSYKENTIPVGQCQDTIKEIPRVDNKIRKKNHLSEITVLNADGKRYYYGLPACNVEQKDVTFAVDKETNSGNLDKGLAQYTAGVDNSTNNSKGKDGYFSRDEMPAYAHNFLLTGIVSTDYVDITGNGISEDDPGDAVKFNYTQVYGEDNGYYQWRIPFEAGKATYNEGLKTYNRDDKGTYLYGKKEVWYLNSIESKTMIAVFHLANDRQDSYAVLGEDGGLNTSRATRRLERIDLYVKSDLIKNGPIKAKPVKTVKLGYTYELCPNVAGNPNSGKLTLKSVSFEYNKSGKGNLNPYVFNYHPDAGGVPQSQYNPSFNARKSDRWGMYKDPADNPAGMSNNDFPYSIQDSTKAARNAAAWSLTDIKLPSGGKMHITYEADDYAFVQDKRATQMMTIAGINQPSQTNLYNQASKDDYYTIYINTAGALTKKEDIKNKYLAVDDVLYFKIAVTMPPDQFGSGIEMIPGYGTIEDYGITPGNNHQFWVRLAQVEGRSPMSRAALQYLRLNLRSKAYPNSEGIDQIGLTELIKMLATSVSEIKNMIEGFDGAAKSKGVCNTVDLTRSFVRLSNPDYKKFGGGYRVKRVEVNDNWNKMTNQKESVYGQEYNYTTSEDVDGKKVIISSGVATYEPAIGGEENPFRRPISYVEKTAPMGPVNFLFSEEPLGEAFFASPMVGYSKVRIRTINAKAKSANGWEESEYYTSRDFPAIAEHTLLEAGDSKIKYETQSNILRLNHKSYVTLSQGFRIELNDMNGKLKATSSYAETDSLHPISYSLNFYKLDDDKALKKHLNNQVWVVDSVNGHIDTAGQIGKDIEIMADLREQRSQAFTKGFSPNADVIAPFIPPFIPVLVLPSRINLPQKEDTRFRSAAIVKIVQRYGILDSMVSMDKGSVASTKNLLYDAETGNVLLTRTNNEFNDPVYNFVYPAYWAYSGMGMAYKNIGAVLQTKGSTGGFQLNEGRLYKEGSTEAYPASRFFESGDEVYVYNAVRAVAGSDCRFLNSTGVSWKGRLWVMEAAKGKEKDNGLYFIDSLGRVAPNMIIGKMVITRSGKRNLPAANVGAVVMLNNPLKLLAGGNYKVVIDSNTRVVNSTAATFRDMWKVENSEYQEDSCYTMTKIVNGAVFYPSVDQGGSSAVFREWVHVVRRRIDFSIPIANIMTWNYATSSRKFNTNGNKHNRYSVRSVMKFNLGAVIKPTDSVTNAVFNLYAGAPTSIWSDVNNSEINYFRQKTRGHYLNGNLYGRTNSSNIRQVTAPWNINTTRFNFLVTGASVPLDSSADATCKNYSPNVTAMVRDMVKNPARNNGFALTLDDISGGIDNDQSSERTLGFCGGSASSSFLKELLAVPSGDCISCSSTTLTVDYRTLKDTCVKVCRKNISDTATNPYRWGILGNWRMDKSYAYYNARKESDATIKTTNIRQEGTLKSFIPYWSFTAAGIVAAEDTSRWVWNSGVSVFQRRGFEVENYNPLGIYIAGLYGYNQSMPVAVGQNTRYREVLFDGFEDYGFKTTTCIACAPKREFDFLKGTIGVDTSTAQSHTGLYSLRVSNGHESLLTVPVDSVVEKEQKLSALMDSIPVTVPQVIGAGTGLSGNYVMGRRRNNLTLCSPTGDIHTRTDATINFDWTSGPPFTPGTQGCNESYRVTWTGSIQPRYSDQYVFYLRYNGTATIIVNGVQLYNNPFSQNGERVSNSIALQAGQLYTISVSYTKTLGVPAGPVAFSWSSFVSQAKEVVPVNFLYPVAPGSANSTGSIINIVQYYCVKAKTVKPENAIRGIFSPITKTKLTVSAWVRLDVADCNATPALDSVIQVQFNTGASTWLKKTGLRIEGWQRYEANINVPANAVTLFLRLKTLSDKSIYVDDIRVQPFNSSMRNFVYNPVNLRLMAQLDENNYAWFYEYDDEGTLIRLKKETERGIMTIQEARSALFKEQ